MTDSLVNLIKNYLATPKTQPETSKKKENFEEFEQAHLGLVGTEISENSQTSELQQIQDSTFKYQQSSTNDQIPNSTFSGFNHKDSDTQTDQASKSQASTSQASSRDVKHIKNVKNGKIYRYTYVQVKCEICRKTCLSDSALDRHKFKVHNIPNDRQVETVKKNAKKVRGSKQTEICGTDVSRISIGLNVSKNDRQGLETVKLELENPEIEKPECGKLGFEISHDGNARKLHYDTPETFDGENMHDLQNLPDFGVPISKQFVASKHQSEQLSNLSCIPNSTMSSLLNLIPSSSSTSNQTKIQLPRHSLSSSNILSTSLPQAVYKPPTKISKIDNFIQSSFAAANLSNLQNSVSRNKALQNLFSQQNIQNSASPTTTLSSQSKPISSISNSEISNSILENMTITSLIQKISEYNPNTPIEDILREKITELSTDSGKRKSPLGKNFTLNGNSSSGQTSGNFIKNASNSYRGLGRFEEEGKPNPDVKTITNIKNGKVYKYTYIQVKCDICRKTCLSENALKRHKAKFHNQDGQN